MQVSSFQHQEVKVISFHAGHSSVCLVPCHIKTGPLQLVPGRSSPKHQTPTTDLECSSMSCFQCPITDACYKVKNGPGATYQTPICTMFPSPKVQKSIAQVKLNYHPSRYSIIIKALLWKPTGGMDFSLLSRELSHWQLQKFPSGPTEKYLGDYQLESQTCHP